MPDSSSSKLPQMRFQPSIGWLKWIAVAGLAVYFATDSYFIVQPTEMAGVRLLRNVHSRSRCSRGCISRHRS